MKLASVSGALGLVTLALAVAMSSGAAAEVSGAASDARAASSVPLTLFVDRNGQTFDVEKLRRALSRELAREVTLAEESRAAAVYVKVESATKAHVHYATPSGETLDREVELPPDRERAVQVVSWLTVNLVRDEASELIDALRARRREEEARALAEREAADKAAADKAAADKAAADKAAADKVAADKAKQNKVALPPPPPPPRPLLLHDIAKSFDLALATPISTVPDSPRRELRVQLALGYGDAGGLRGVAVSPSVLRVRHDLWGASVALAANIVGGNVRGAVASIGYSHVEGNLEGVQIGVGAAVQRGKLARGVVGGVGGAIAGDVDGAVFGAGIASARSLAGVGISAGITAIRGPSEGVLFAGGVNFSQDLRGVEVAGGVNVARDLEGIAIAPLNIQRKVSGLQIGVINIAEDVDGAQIGVVSLSKSGRFQPTFWGGSDGSVHLALKSISGFGFTQLGAGIDVHAAELSYDGGIGAHLKVSDSWFVEPGVHYSGVHPTDTTSGTGEQHRLHYLGLVGLRLGNKLDLLAGGGVRQTFVGDKGVRPEVRVGIAFF